MPLIEVVSSEEEEEVEKKDVSVKEKVEVIKKMQCIVDDPRSIHPAASLRTPIPEYEFDREETTFESHPASAKSAIRDIKKATEFKEQGNIFFKSKEYENAIQCFTKAIYTVPIDTDRYHYNVSVYYGNRAACFVQTKQYERAISDCDKSLNLNPTYVKVMMRRSKANECLDKMEDALEDAKSAYKAAPTFTKAGREVRRLEILVKNKHEKMKEEVFGKLKDLGNSILGNFGMSMDNFKAVQDPKTGSYSISYQS